MRQSASHLADTARDNHPAHDVEGHAEDVEGGGGLLEPEEAGAGKPADLLVVDVDDRHHGDALENDLRDE